ncbi:MAG TPA: hypothetical protein VEV61_11545 [Streptosporangiaceae bacterium]|nr:hypothetical protein [Streptosporangiaceae bacterium]
MSTDFEQRLQAEMGRVAVRSRPGLVTDAYRGYQGKRRMTRAVVAGATAAAIAAGTAVGVAATTTSPIAVPVQMTAYVVGHVRSALAASNRMAYTRLTTSVPKFARPHLRVPVRDGWSYGNRHLTLFKSPRGQLLSEEWVRTGHGKPTLIVVNYQHRWWERLAINPAATESRTVLCHAPELFLLGPAAPGAQSAAAADWKTIIESGLRCGRFHVTGRQPIHGIDAIKLTSTEFTGFILWVDARTYLPVEMAGKIQMGEPIGKNEPKPFRRNEWNWVMVTTWLHFRWLAPTRAGLAHLTGTIPPGFRQLPNTTSP